MFQNQRVFLYLVEDVKNIPSQFFITINQITRDFRKFFLSEITKKEQKGERK